MRTKALLCAAALAAGALTSMAQVYSANVVGYVNVFVGGGGQYTMIANPLDATMGGTVVGGNALTNLFGSVAGQGDQIFRWDVSLYDFSPSAHIYNSVTKQWSNPFQLNPGEGIWYINNNNDFTVTFVGQVLQGFPAFTYAGGINGDPNVVTGGGAYNALGAAVPIGGAITNSIIGMTPGQGDQIFAWNVGLYDFDPTAIVYNSVTQLWSNGNFTNAPGVGYIYINNNNDFAWSVNFTVQ